MIWDLCRYVSGKISGERIHPISGAKRLVQSQARVQKDRWIHGKSWNTIDILTWPYNQWSSLFLALCRSQHFVGILRQGVEAVLAQPEADHVQGAVAPVALTALYLHRRAALVSARQEVLWRLRPRGQVHGSAHQAQLRQRGRVQDHQVRWWVKWFGAVCLGAEGTSMFGALHRPMKMLHLWHIFTEMPTWLWTSFCWHQIESCVILSGDSTPHGHPFSSLFQDPIQN